MEITTNLN